MNPHGAALQPPATAESVSETARPVGAGQWTVGAPRVPAERAVGLFRITDPVAALAALVVSFVVLNFEAAPVRMEEFLLLRITVRNALLLAGFLLLWPLVFILAGLYDSAKIRTPATEAIRVLWACSLIAASSIALVVASVSGAFQPRVVPVFWLGSTALVYGVRCLIRWLLFPNTTEGPRQVIIVGSGPRTVALYRQLSVGTHAHVLGFVDSASDVDAAEIRARMLGPVENLEAILACRVVDEVVIALPIKSCYQQVQEVITVCERVGVEVRYLADLFQSTSARVRYEPVATSPSVVHKVATDDARLLVKRCVDVIGAALGMVLLTPLFIAIAIAVRLDTAGPVLFSHPRYGLNKRRFWMYKFRTMVENASELQNEVEHLNEANGPIFKIRADPRITRVGRWLRRTSLDELPQLFNVLRGDMSLVGPRPMSVRDVELFGEPWWLRRFSVRPGITGLWQVSGRSDLSFDDWIKLDLRYIDNWSLSLDCKILALTIPAVVRGTGAA